MLWASARALARSLVEPPASDRRRVGAALIVTTSKDEAGDAPVAGQACALRASPFHRGSAKIRKASYCLRVGIFWRKTEDASTLLCVFSSHSVACPEYMCIIRHTSTTGCLTSCYIMYTERHLYVKLCPRVPLYMEKNNNTERRCGRCCLYAAGIWFFHGL